MRHDTSRPASFGVTPPTGRALALALIAALLAAFFAAPAAAQRLDDSYKGPTQGGGLDSQLRQMSLRRRYLRGRGRAMRRRLPAAVCRAGRRRARLRRFRLRFRCFWGPTPSSPTTSPTSSPPTSITPVCSSRSTARSFLEQVRDVNAAPRFPDWRSIRADALVVGRVGLGPDGRIVAEFRLWDVAAGKQLTGQRFATSAQNWRRVGPHHRRSGLPAAHWREGLLRHARRLRRRDGAEAEARQAARDHGPGRRRTSVS